MDTRRLYSLVRSLDVDALTALHTAADPVRSGKVLLRFG